MPDTHLFLSDAHFGAFDEETNRKIEADLAALIRYCLEKRIQLYILGDLFDYWMEYPGHHPAYGEHLLDEFRRYMHEMGPVLYITGNHDNWTRGHFEQTGFDVESDYRVIQLNGHTFFLHHGDGLNEPELNLPRPRFHRLLRNRQFIELYQMVLRPKQGLKLMQLFSSYSRSRPVSEPERLNRWSEEYLCKSKTDFVICGHDHIPRIETFRCGVYINSGPFYSHRTAVKYTNGQIELVVWDSRGNRLTPFEINDTLVNKNW